MANYNASTIYRGVDKASPVMDKMARNALKNSQKIQHSYSKMASKAGKAVGKAGLNVAKYAGLAAVGIATYATKKAIGDYLDFEREMLGVKAVTRSTAEEYDHMTKAAVRMASKSIFTSKQTAEGMKFLGIAGWSTSKIIAGMPGVLALAAATGSDLAMSSDMLSDSMTTFKFKAEAATHVADVFSAATSSANLNLEQMKEAMKDGAPAAMQFGTSIEETSAIIGVMADNGIKGTKAGIAFKNMTMNLAAQTPKAAKWLKQMNVEVADNGKMRSFTDIMDDLRVGLKGLTQQQQIIARKAIFGKIAAAGAAAILSDTEGKVKKLTKAYKENINVASGMADIRLDGASGAVDKLASSWDALAITLVKGIAPAMQTIAEELTELLTGDLSATNKEIQAYNITNIEKGRSGVFSPLSGMSDERFKKGYDIYSKQYRDPYKEMYTPASAHATAKGSNLFNADALKLYKDMYEAKERRKNKRYEESGTKGLRESYDFNLGATLKETTQSPMMQLMKEVIKTENTIIIKAPKGVIEAPEKLPSNIMLVETMA